MKKNRVLSCLSGFLGIIIIGIGGKVSAQNLVTNPGFETQLSCPTTSSQITLALPWAASSHSPDYLHTCSASPYATLPTNFWGNEPAFAGNGVMGALFYGSFASSYLANLREYMYGSLSTNLTPGTTYYVSFRANLADNSSHAVSHLGVKFTNNYVSTLPIPNSADVFTPSVVTQQNGYALISGTFVPSISYSNFMVGNFFQDALITVQTIGPTQIGHNAYYFIDEVCVSTNPADCGLAILPTKWGDISAHPVGVNSVQIQWETLEEMDSREFRIERSFDGDNFEEVGSLKAAGLATQSRIYAWQDRPGTFGKPLFYRVRLIDQNGSSHTSEIVETTLSGETGAGISLRNNPVSIGENFQIDLAPEFTGETRVCLFSPTGQLLLERSIDASGYNHEIELGSQGLAPGVYQLKVQSGALSRSLSLLLVR